MKKNWRIVVGVGALLLAVLVAVRPTNLAQADEQAFLAHLPMIGYRAQQFIYRFDDFDDVIPEWFVGATKEPWTCNEDGTKCFGDGFFEHLGGKYQAHIRDNAAQMVDTPYWSTQGDFKLGVKARFASEFTIEERLKSLNAMGLVFGANEDFTKYYAFLLSDGGAQHYYALVYVNKTKFETIYGWRGAPNFVKNWSGTNKMEVIRQGDLIQIMCNGKMLPGGDDLHDSRLGDGYVGVIVTSYEFANGEMQFNDFELTPLTN